MAVDERQVIGISGGAPSSWRLPSHAVALLVAGLLLPLWPLRAALVWIWRSWLDSPEYSHGLVLPCVTAYLIWQRRAQLRSVEFVGSWAGVGVTFAGVLLALLGDLSALFIVQELALWLLISGVLLALVGGRAFRILAGPLALLLLAIPLPVILLNNLSAQLQLWSSGLGSALLRAIGVSVYLQGNVLDLGSYQLEVAEACSGLRYLFPLISLAAIMSYLYRGPWVAKLLILAAAPPLTLFMNSLRIASVGVLVERYGSGVAQGFLHDFQGWAVFMVTAAVLLGLLALLHRWLGGGRPWRGAFGFEAAQGGAGSAAQRRTVPASFVAAFALCGALCAASLALPERRELPAPRLALAAFPDQLGGWYGRRAGLGREYLDALKLDDYLLSDYHQPGGEFVNVYIAYYSSQRAGGSVHSPRACLPGGGWEVREFAPHVVRDVAPSGRPLVVNRSVMAQGNSRQLVYYWFQQRGRVGTSEIAVKAWLLWDALSRRRTDGAVVRLVTPLPSAGGEDAADRRLSAMAAALALELPRFVPD
jgi:exosortase D (VPLPA-CTERM-specific)